MAWLRAVFPLVLGLVFFPSTGSAFQVYVPTSSKAELGTNVSIPCTFKECSSGITQQYLAIVWEFEGNVIVRYDSKGIQKQPRKYIDEKNIKEGAADLYIHNASIGDIGTYKCTVICSPERSHKEVNLTVYARPTISALDKMTVGNEQDKILCSVSRFYPVQITVELIKDGAVMSGSVLSSPRRNGDKTFSINSSVILPSTEKPKSLSCRVRHESLTEPLLQDIQLVYKDSGSDNIGLVVGVIAGAVIVVSVIAAVLYKRRSGSSDVLVNKIHGTKMMDGENGSLYCTACNCSQETQVQWIIQHKDGTTCDITEKNSGDTEEGQPLMSMEYKVSTEKVPSQKRKSCYDITTTLSFIPSVSRHLGSTVTCRFTTNKKSEEATHKLKDIYAKPQFMESLRFSITDQGDVQLSASLLRFYPQPLQISWTSKRGQSQEKIPSDEEDMKNPDATFTLTSKCTVSGELFKDPMNKVTVTWKHESIDNPQFKEISAKDLPWRPRIVDSIERVIQGDTILFKSLVSDYFPDALTVKWFQKKKDCPEFIEVTESEIYTIPNIVSSRTDKKTFTTTSCLSLKKSLLTEDDVVFICRVDHPSLEKPMEAKTGQQPDTEVQAFFVNNIQGPQRWYDGEKVTLYCAASYCTQNTRVIWIVTGKDGTEHEICEDSGGTDMKKDGGQCPGYVAHRERTDVSDIQDLLDVTSCLTFTPSVSKHKPITISCRVTCEGRVKKKTFQRKQLYAKPKVRSPIKLSLTNSDDVLCALDIEEFYPSDIQIRWNDKENPILDKTVKNADGTYSVHSEYKLPGSFFKDPQSWVKVSWKHESMDGWEWRQMSAVDKDFPWRPELREIPVPNLLAGIAATLKCEVSSVFPDVLSVRWLKKEKDGQDLFPLVHGDKYMISDLTGERQKDNTFIYRGCIMFTPSVSEDQGAEFIFRVEHPSLGKPAEKSTGPLYIQDLSSSHPSQEKSDTHVAPQEEIEDLAATRPQKSYQRFVVGDIRGRDQWTHGRKVTLQCPVSYCPEDVTVLWSVTEGDGKVQAISGAAAQSRKEREALKTSGYYPVQETDRSDVEGLYNTTSILTFIPTVIKHYGCLITCTVTSDGETKAKTFQPKSLHANPQVSGPVEASLTDSGDVICSLTLQNFYPKHITVRWTTGQNPLKSKEKLQENTDHTYNVCSRCPVQGSLFKDPNFKLTVTWKHKSMKEERRVLSWRDEDNSFPWRPVIQEVPVPHVLMGQPNTLQYNISGYYPDALTVSWYKKDKGALESVPVHDTYKTSVTESQRQPDSTYSCTASLLFTPTLKDGESEVICRVDHPSLEGPLERSTGPLRVQGKPKSRKPISVTLGKEEVKCSLVLERFYPRDIQITWDCVSEQETQCCPSTERFTTNMDKSYGVTSDCRIPEKDLKNPNVKVRVMWIHESMDDPGSREMAIRDEGFPWRPVIQEVPVPHVLMGQPNTLQYNISGYYPDALTVSWYKKDKGALESVPVHDKYKTSVTESQRQPDSTYSCTASLLFTPTLKDGESEVICRVDHPSLEGPLERSTGPLRVQGKPKSRKPISVTLGKEEVKCSLVLERFYPRDIQITWVCVSEQETQRCPSTERFTTNMDKSYGVTSDCRIPEKDLKNPNVKVRVMWIHESMDDPGSREMAIRDEDYPYRPAVNIQVPLLYNNSEASLECTVSNCFPDVISGMWIKKDRQTGETDHIAGDGAYRISHHELGRQPNNTYSYKSCLIFTPSVESHQGAEFIFQVEHPSVEHPMQKSTGALQIADAGDMDI